MSNFTFLSEHWPILAELGDLAERNLHHDPNTTLIKLRMFGEIMAKYLMAYEKLEEPADGKQLTRLNILNTIIPYQLFPLFHSLRKTGNKASHEHYGSVDEASTHLRFAHHLAVWFGQTRGTQGGTQGTSIRLGDLINFKRPPARTHNPFPILHGQGHRRLRDPQLFAQRRRGQVA